jgi:hypothetical protein
MTPHRSATAMASRRSPADEEKGSDRKEGISVWNLITCPFFLTQSGFKTGEIASLDIDGEEWRRLQFTFPNRTATELETPPRV